MAQPWRCCRKPRVCCSFAGTPRAHAHTDTLTWPRVRTETASSGGQVKVAIEGKVGTKADCIIRKGINVNAMLRQAVAAHQSTVSTIQDQAKCATIAPSLAPATTTTARTHARTHAQPQALALAREVKPLYPSCQDQAQFQPKGCQGQCAEDRSRKGQVLPQG